MDSPKDTSSAPDSSFAADDRQGQDIGSVPKLRKSVIQEFHLLWDNGAAPDVGAFLRQYPELTTKEIAEILSADQWQRWQRGERLSTPRYRSHN
jgi:hypothetical protein